MSLEILGIASDIAGGKLGSAQGVKSLCSYMTDQNLATLHAQNYITLENTNIPTPKHDDKAKHIEFLYNSLYSQVAKQAESIIKNNAFPFIISGDHSSAIAAVQGIQNALPYDNIGIIWIDAHADIHTPFDTCSGNLHGMPLAALIGHKTSNNNAVASTQQYYWDKISSIAKDSIQPQHVVYCGVRSLEQDEKDIIESYRMCMLDIATLRHDRKSCLHKMQKQLSQTTKVYISVDVDVLDCNVFQSTGCNEPCGLYIEELIVLVIDIIETFEHSIVAFELSEFNPTLGNQKEKDMIMLQDFLYKVTKSLKTK